VRRVSSPRAWMVLISAWCSRSRRYSSNAPAGISDSKLAQAASKSTRFLRTRSNARAMIEDMKRDTIEILIGFCGIILFGVGLVVWPQFADTLGQLGLSYLRDLVHSLFGSLFS
jgi:hypothetical protein